MKAIIMAGGKGKRLHMDIEKPLLEIDGKTILERVSEVLGMAGMKEIIVAITENTPQVEKKARMLNLEVIKTPAEGYVEDIQYLKEIFGEFIAVSADLPFLTPSLIKSVLEEYRKKKRPICVVVSKEGYEKMGFFPSATLGDFVPIGVNMVAHGEDCFMVTEGKETINVNTVEEWEKVRSMKKDELNEGEGLNV